MIIVYNVHCDNILKQIMDCRLFRDSRTDFHSAFIEFQYHGNVEMDNSNIYFDA